MRRYERAIVDAYQQSPDTLCVLSAISILLIDILTGEKIHFPIFFAIPAGLAAWQLNRPMAYTLAVILPLLRVGFFYMWDGGPLDKISILNATIIIIALSAYVYLITRIILEKRELEGIIEQLQGEMQRNTSKKLPNEKADEQTSLS
jgi:hypothetical protein